MLILFLLGVDCLRLEVFIGIAFYLRQVVSVHLPVFSLELEHVLLCDAFLVLPLAIIGVHLAYGIL